MGILRETYFVQGLCVLAAVGLLTKLLVWKSYRKLLLASDHMEQPSRNWIGVLKKKFENYYQLDANVHNIACIVDKYFENHKILGINASFWEQIPGFCSILCVLLGCIGSVRGVVAGADPFLWIQSLMISISAGIGIFMLDYLFRLDHTKQLIRANLIHFLENVMPNRVDKTIAKNQKNKKEQLRQKAVIQEEKEKTEQIVDHWEQIASAKEFHLTQKDLQTLKDFINDL